MKKFVLLAVAALSLVGCRKLAVDEAPIELPFPPEDEVGFVHWEIDFDKIEYPDDKEDDDGYYDDDNIDGFVDLSRFIDDRPYYHYEALYEGKFKPTPDKVISDSYYEFTFKEGSFNEANSNFALTDAVASEVFENTLAIGNGRERGKAIIADHTNTKFFAFESGELGVFKFKGGAQPYALAFKVNRQGLLTYFEEYVTTSTGFVRTVINATYSSHSSL